MTTCRNSIYHVVYMGTWPEHRGSAKLCSNATTRSGQSRRARV